MAVNRSSAVRTDLPFLSRRVKPRAASSAAAAPASTPAAAPATPPRTPPPPTTAAPPASAPGSLTLSSPTRAAQPAPPSPSLSLGLSPNAEAASTRSASRPGTSAPSAPSLGAPSGAPSAPARTVPAPLHTRLFPAPGIREVRMLDRNNPVLRLTPMESAVGSLAISGTIHAVWEDWKYTTGGMPAGPLDRGTLEGTLVETPGNRPLVGYEDDLALIPLRHAGLLRRALFFPQPKQAMTVGIYNGQSVTIPPKAGERTFYVLSVLRIGEVLELRAEILPYGMELKAIWEAFGFTITSFPGRNR